ncbi:hypothetical protein CBR_g54024 [Chara braunii]|uniref:Uncharacterized protein n=1 Tax=Chara braunii TaxID=69332 RepID=A0A388MBU5_CHABU|nr:hypothetical protein CBR_g54024 [Chara braunii]|eukprot:GBG91929.1 hypothetical protein CBR_g54024 [Chara braunii]
MVDTRSGKSTTPYTKEQEEKAAAILRERKEKMEKRELIKQTKMPALIEEQKAKQKQMEELQKWKKEQEEKLAAIESETEEEEVEQPLERRRVEERGESSGVRGTKVKMEAESKMERMVNEWVANLAPGEEDEALLLVPLAEREQFARELEGEENPRKRQAMEEEKKLEWKLRLACKKKRRLEAAKKMDEDLILVAFHALKDGAVSFARSLARAAKCENGMVAYCILTPLSEFLSAL